jgi:hypothetical protein
MSQGYYYLYAGRGGEIRTPDPLLPKQMRYQAALRPDFHVRLYREKGSLRVAGNYSNVLRRHNAQTRTVTLNRVYRR